MNICYEYSYFSIHSQNDFIILSSTMLPHVPFDVLLLIIDQCRKDKASLTTCSLVCRAWLNPSRSHLFRDTTIKVPHRTDEPVRDFIRDLLFSDMQLGHNITTLRIVGSDRFTPWIQLRNPYSPIILTIAFYPVFSQLPRLRSLSFVNVRFITLDFAMSHFVSDKDDRPSIDYLEINSCLDSGDKANGMVNFISLFSSIRTLVLDLEHYGNPLQPSVEQIPHRHPVSVRSVILRGMVNWWSSCLSHHFKDAFRFSDGTPHPSECLNIWPHWGREWKQLKGISSFVELNASTIRSLRVNPMQLIVAKPEESKDILFSRCTFHADLRTTSQICRDTGATYGSQLVRIYEPSSSPSTPPTLPLTRYPKRSDARTRVSWRSSWTLSSLRPSSASHSTSRFQRSPTRRLRRSTGSSWTRSSSAFGGSGRW